MKLTQQDIENIANGPTVANAALQAAPLFRLLGWEWVNDTKGIHVPTLREIEDHIRDMVVELLTSNSDVVSSGRISVRATVDEGDFLVVGIFLGLGELYHDATTEGY